MILHLNKEQKQGVLPWYNSKGKSMLKHFNGKITNADITESYKLISSGCQFECTSPKQSGCSVQRHSYLIFQFMS